MNKTAKITIGALSVLMLFFVLMAQIQRAEVDKQKIAALEHAAMALKSKQEAERQAELALASAAQAREAENKAHLAMQELRDCQKGK